MSRKTLSNPYPDLKVVEAKGDEGVASWQSLLANLERALVQRLGCSPIMAQSKAVAPNGLANAAIRVEIETRQERELSFANQIVIAPLALNVGIALGRSHKV